MVVPIIVAGARVAGSGALRGASRSVIGTGARTASQGIREGVDSVSTGVRQYGQHSIRRARRMVVGRFKKEAQEILGDDLNVQEFIDEFNTAEQLKDIASIEVRTPNFPTILFGLALFFDVMDIADVTGVGYFIMLIVKICFTIYLFFWFFGKLSGLFKFGSRVGAKVLRKKINRLVKRTIGKRMSKRLAAIFIVNIIPLIGILASNAWFVYLAHNSMNKTAQQYIRLVESAGMQLRKLRP